MIDDRQEQYLKIEDGHNNLNNAIFFSEFKDAIKNNSIGDRSFLFLCSKCPKRRYSTHRGVKRHYLLKHGEYGKGPSAILKQAESHILVKPIRESMTAFKTRECRMGANVLTAHCGCKSYTYVAKCFIRYCDYCYKNKKMRNLARIEPYKFYFKNNKGEYQFRHIILTIPSGKLTKDNKAFLEDSRRKLFQMLRRKNVDLKALSVFDPGHKKGKAEEQNLHLHVVINLHYLRWSWIRKLWSRATKIDNAVVRDSGQVSISRAFDYLARRMSGELGHGSDYIFYKDEGMTPIQYEKTLKGTRSLGVCFPKGLCSKDGAKESQSICYECGEEIQIDAQYRYGSLVWKMYEKSGET